MKYQILTLENKKISLYKDNTIKLFNWNIEELIKNIERDKKLYIIYLEKIIYYKSLFLYDLDKKNIDYEIISKNLIEIKKYIYDSWIKEKKEIIEINKVHLFILIDLSNIDLNISIFEIKNTINRLEIQKLYEDYTYIRNTNDEQYLFMDIIREIQKIMRESFFRDKTIAKILLIGEEVNYQWFIKLFEENYSKELIDLFNYEIIEALKVYLDVENKEISDPFTKQEIRYFPKQIRLEEIIKDIGVQRSIEVIKEHERIPIDKDIIVSPVASIKNENIFRIELDNKKYDRKISFPFIYFFDELKFKFTIKNKKTLKINIYINDSVVDVWNIDWGD